jgi:hypothetical protein
MLIVAAICAVFTVTLAMRLPIALKQFADLFKSFGVEIHAATKFVLGTGPVWWVFAAASVAVFIWVAVRGQPGIVEHRRMKIALRTVIVATVLAYGCAAIAIYSPMFRMGAVV